tara:strand:- start:68 stop:544 length:477 start_codon:yes stop_codon:yes gene_type:complete
MNQNKLQQRLSFVKATDLKDRASLKVFSRREAPDIRPEEEGEDGHETFFDFEEELSGLRSSAEQFNNVINSDPYVIMEERETSEENNYTESSSVIMDDIEEPPVSAISMEEAVEKPVKKFEFIRCEHIKDDGIRCKRQAKKNEVLCAAHRKMLNKNRS